MICTLWAAGRLRTTPTSPGLREELYRTPRTARARFAHGAR
jgi:hypothetical protein